MATPPLSMAHEVFISAVDHVIRKRKTAKILRDPDNCGSTQDLTDFNEAVRASVEVAGWAPFHKTVHKPTHCMGELTSPVPWRFYVLEKATCCAVVDFISAQAQVNPNSHWHKAWGSKIPKLLAGCGAVVLATWLPDPAEDGGAPELTENNIEHIAAASAAVQNLLLAAEARGLHTYWSSGGILKDAAIFAYLSIAPQEKLLGAIFLAPHDAPHDANEPGGLRDKRGAPAAWSRWVNLE
jgi:nitroreductase